MSRAAKNLKVIEAPANHHGGPQVSAADRVAQRWLDRQAKRESAADAYDRLDADITAMLKMLPKLRVLHRRKFETGRMPCRNWGYPGDLGHVKDQLAEVLRGLGGG